MGPCPAHVLDCIPQIWGEDRIILMHTLSPPSIVHYQLIFDIALQVNFPQNVMSTLHKSQLSDKPELDAFLGSESLK